MRVRCLKVESGRVGHRTSRPTASEEREIDVGVQEGRCVSTRHSQTYFNFIEVMLTNI